MMFLTTTLFLWSLIALGWWIFCRLWVAREFSKKNQEALSLQATPKSTLSVNPTDKGLSIFKPIPDSQDPLKTQQTFLAIESFLSQMTPRHELLLGISKNTFPHWEAKIHHWRTDYPRASIQVLHESDSFSHPNPKIRWNHRLSSCAQADLWLWSDADITVPPHYLKTLLTEWHESPQGFLTNSYYIHEIQSKWGVSDHLFIRFEFLPGVFLVDHFGSKKSAFGAGILFHREHLPSDASWDTLGSRIADDFQLAQMIGHGRLSKIIVKTSAQDISFYDSFQHYQRWHKTIRWCNPLGYLGMILLNPLIGWIFFALFQPLAWIGAMTYGILESIIVSNCTPPHPKKFSTVLPYLGWPWMRAYTWIWAWLPTTVIWGGTRWGSNSIFQCKAHTALSRTDVRE